MLKQAEQRTIGTALKLLNSVSLYLVVWIGGLEVFQGRGGGGLLTTHKKGFRNHQFGVVENHESGSAPYNRGRVGMGVAFLKFLGAALLRFVGAVFFRFLGAVFFCSTDI